MIARAGKPVAKLVRYDRPAEPRRLGLWKGKVWVAPDFDDPDPGLERLFDE